MQENPVGEVDIIEGTSYQEDNIVSVHTSNKCHFYRGKQTGVEQRSNCTLLDPITGEENWCVLRAQSAEACPASGAGRELTPDVGTAAG